MAIIRLKSIDLSGIGSGGGSGATYNFRDGLQKSGDNVSVKIDSNSESYLTVSSSGVSLSGIDSAITSAYTINKEKIEELSGVTAEMDEVIATSLCDLDSRITEIGSGITEIIEENERITAAAFNGVNKKFDDYYTSAQTETIYAKPYTAGTNISITNNVISTTFDITFVKLTQAQYDALAVKEPNTMYIIIG